MIVCKINNHDYSKYIARRGLQWTRNDVDSEKSTRLKNGSMRRYKITDKRTVVYEFVNMPVNIMQQLDDDLRNNVTFNLTYVDVHGVLTKKFYCTSFSATLEEIQNGDYQQWSVASATFVEV